MSGSPNFPSPKEVFISYVRSDERLCKHVSDFLTSIGVSVYVDSDPNTRVAGEWELRLQSAISQAKVLLVLWTERFASKKDNVAELEIEIAKDKGKKILPLWFDDSKGLYQFLYKKMRKLDCVEFFANEYRSNPYKDLYKILENSGVKVHKPEPTDFSRYFAELLVLLQERPSQPPQKPAGEPPLFFHATLDEWCVGEANACLKQLLGLAAHDGPVAELVRSNAICEACRTSVQALQCAISFANLRLTLVCNLIAAAREGSAVAAWRAMACAVALRRSPCVAGGAGFEWETLSGALDHLNKQIVSRMGTRTVEDAGSWTLEEHQGFEDEIASVIESGGGVVIQINGRPTSFAFGPAFALTYDVNHSVQRRALAMPAVQELFAFSPDLGMAAYLHRQGRHERLLRISGEILAGYASAPHQASGRLAARVLTDGALGVMEDDFVIGKLQSGSAPCELVRQAIRYLRLLKDLGCLAGENQARLHRILASFADSLDSCEISEWLQRRLDECVLDLDSFGDAGIKDICRGIRRKVSYRAAVTAYHRSEFDRTLALMSPLLDTLGELPDQNLDVLFRALTQLALRTPKEHLASLQSVLEEQRRRKGESSDLETKKAILRNITLLAERDAGAIFAEKLRGYNESQDPEQVEQLLGAAEEAITRCAERGDADCVEQLLRQLPATQRQRTEQMLLGVIPNIKDAGVQQKVADYLLASYSESISPSGEMSRSVPVPLEPAEFASRYANATLLEKIDLGSQLRRWATEMFEQRTYTNALAYLAEITARAPGDAPLSELVSDLTHEWSAKLGNDPQALDQLRQAVVPTVLPAVARIDVNVPVPLRPVVPSASRVDPEREAVLSLLERLEARDRERRTE